MHKKEIIKSIIIVIVGSIIAFLILNVNKGSIDELIAKNDPKIDDESADEVILPRGEWEGINSQYWASTYFLDEETGRLFFITKENYDNPSLGIEMKNADPQTFKILLNRFGYAKDKYGVYCGYKLQKDIDAESFVVFNIRSGDHIYAKDKNHVYKDCAVASQYDQVTFDVIHNAFTRDVNGVYYNDNLITPTQGEGLVVIDGYYFMKDIPSLFSLSAREAVGDKSYLFSSNSTGNIKLTRATFEITDGGKVNREAFENTQFMILESTTTSAHASLVLAPSAIQSESDKLIYKNKLYFTHANGNDNLIGVFDFSNNTTSFIDLISLAGIVESVEKIKIVDILIDSNILYALIGSERCGEYMAQCETDLYQYDLNTHLTKKIISNLRAEDIQGLDERRQNINVTRSFGDAGYWSIVYQIINLNTLTKTEFPFGGGESGDPEEDKALLEKAAAFGKVYSSNYITVKNFSIKNGVIVPPTKSDDYNYSRFQYIVQ